MTLRAFWKGHFWKARQAETTAEYAAIVAIMVIVAAGAIRLIWSAIFHIGQ